MNTPHWHWSKQPNKEEILKQISKKLKGRKPNSGSFKSGHISFVKGKKLPWADKAAEGRRASGMYEDLSHLKNFKKGNIPWNKGKVGVMPIPWNKGTHCKMPEPTNKGLGVGASLGLAIRGLPEYMKWRLAVFERDLYTCVSCGSKGVKFHVDHIKPFALICRENNIDSVKLAISCKELWLVKNGQTLCVPCHKKTKTYSGKVQTMLYKFPRK